MSIKISSYFSKNLSEKSILALIIGVVSVFTITLSNFNLPVSEAPSAAPSISSIEGGVANDSNVIIRGSGFGTKTQASPLRWDDFDSGTLGARLPSQVNGGWTTGASQAGKEPRYSNTHVRLPDTLSAYQNFTGGNYNSEISLQGVFDGEVYMSGWFYRTASGAPSRNFKWIQLRQGDLDERSWEFRQDAYPSTNSGHMYVANSCPNGVPCSLCDDEIGIPGYTSANCNMYYGMNGDLKTGSWHRYEIWMTQGTLGQNDGHARIWLDGQPWMDMNGIFDPSGCRFHNMWLGFYFATDTGTPQPQMETWWDELYVDVSPARVELCTGASWSNKGQCEIQIPNSWNNNSIQIAVNQGTFTTGQQLYAYVLDSNNIANQSGYAVTMSSGNNPPVTPPATDTQAPSVPSNLSASATSTQIILDWLASTDNVGVSRYLIERSNSASTGFSQIATATANSYNDTGLANNATYYYRVRAVDVANNYSAYSNIVNATTPTGNNIPPVTTYSAWCSALSGIVSSAVMATSTINQVADLNHDGVVNLNDLSLMNSWYGQSNDAACQAQFSNTYNSNNYLNVDWCNGTFKGLQDSLGASQGQNNYSIIFDINNDGRINLTDTVLISQYKAANNQSACFAKYNLPLSTTDNQSVVKSVVLVSKAVQDSQRVRQNEVKTIAVKVKKQTAQQIVRTLKNRLVYDEVAQALFYVNTKSKVIVFDNSSLVQQLAKQALGISINNLTQIATGLVPGGDTDGDGLADSLEAAIGTDINRADTDGDGIADGIEVANKYNPLKSSRAKLSDSLAKRLGVGRILIDSQKGNIWIIGADYKKYLIESGTNINTLKELYLVITVDGVGLK